MKRALLTTALVILTAITLSPGSIDADIAPPKPLTVQETIVKYAQVFAVPEKELLTVAQCESGFNPKAIGDQGHAVNIFQFHKPTFETYAQKLGENLDYYSYHDQAKLAAYMFSIKQQKHWTCWIKNFK